MFTTPPRQFWGQLLQEMVLVSLEVQISRCSDYLHDKASLQASHTYMSEPVLKSESFIYVAEYILIIHNRSCIADKDITCEIVRSIRIRRSQRMTPPSKREGMIISENFCLSCTLVSLLLCFHFPLTVPLFASTQASQDIKTERNCAQSHRASPPPSLTREQ